MFHVFPACANIYIMKQHTLEKKYEAPQPQLIK